MGLWVAPLQGHANEFLPEECQLRRISIEASANYCEAVLFILAAVERSLRVALGPVHPPYGPFVHPSPEYVLITQRIAASLDTPLSGTRIAVTGRRGLGSA